MHPAGLSLTTPPHPEEEDLPMAGGCRGSGRDQGRPYLLLQQQSGTDTSFCLLPALPQLPAVPSLPLHLTLKERHDLSFCPPLLPSRCVPSAVVAGGGRLSQGQERQHLLSCPSSLT